MVALAPADLEETPETADPGVVEPDGGAQQADAAAAQPSGDLARLPDPAERAQDYAGRSKSAATIARRLVVISQAHKAADLPSRTGSSLVRRVHAGIRRTLGTAQQGKAPAVVGDLKLMLEQLPNTRVGLRDRALLLLGFAGALCRPLAQGGVGDKRGRGGGFRAGDYVPDRPPLRRYGQEVHPPGESLYLKPGRDGRPVTRSNTAQHRTSGLSHIHGPQQHRRSLAPESMPRPGLSRGQDRHGPGLCRRTTAAELAWGTHHGT